LLQLYINQRNCLHHTYTQQKTNPLWSTVHEFSNRAHHNQAKSHNGSIGNFHIQCSFTKPDSCHIRRHYHRLIFLIIIESLMYSVAALCSHGRLGYYTDHWQINKPIHCKYINASHEVGTICTDRRGKFYEKIYGMKGVWQWLHKGCTLCNDWKLWGGNKTIIL